MFSQTNENADELLLYFIIFVGSLYFISITFRLDPNPRHVPLLVLVTLIIATILQLIIVGLEWLGIELDKLLPSNRSNSKLLSRFAVENPDTATIDDTDSNRTLHHYVRPIIWAIIFPIAFYVFGLVLAMPSLLFIFLLVESDLDIIRNLTITILTSITMYIIFIILMNIYMFSGVIW